MPGRAALIFLLVGLTLLACSGPPESRVALSEPGETPYDERLVGIWYAIDKKTDTIYLHISPRKETAYLDVVGIFAGFGESDPVRWIRATAHASKIDGRIYYNVQRVAGAGFDYTALGESPGFIVVRADVTGQDALSLNFMSWPDGDNLISDYPLRDFLKKGRVIGREVEGKYKDEKVPYLMLDLSRPELVDLIREVTPERLFKEVIRFRRLKPEAEKAKP